MDIKITGLDNLEKALNQMANPRNIEAKILIKGVRLECPNCHTSFIAHTVNTNCPSCNKSITINFKANR